MALLAVALGCGKQEGAAPKGRPPPLVTTQKVGRVRTCMLGPRRLEEEGEWMEMYRELWDARFDELDKVVEEMTRKEQIDGPED